MKKSVWDLSKTLRKLFIKEKGLLSKIVFFCALAASVGGAVYHVICTSCEWFYVKLGGGESSVNCWIKNDLNFLHRVWLLLLLTIITE